MKLIHTYRKKTFKTLISHNKTDSIWGWFKLPNLHSLLNNLETNEWIPSSGKQKLFGNKRSKATYFSWNPNNRRSNATNSTCSLYSASEYQKFKIAKKWKGMSPPTSRSGHQAIWLVCLSFKTSLMLGWST